MRIGFWNTKKNLINSYLASFVIDFRLDVLVLAEYNDDMSSLESQLSHQGCAFNYINTYGCERIKIMSSIQQITPGFQDAYSSIIILKKKYILCCVHLPSDLRGNHSDERSGVIAPQIMKEIRELEIKYGDHTIILGDMNEMPYGNTCLGATAFHGIPIQYRGKTSREINGSSFRMYYNPMWNLLGDFQYPPGTFYYRENKVCNPFWFMLDQVIISQSLAPRLLQEELRIVTEIGQSSLSKTSGIPNDSISDHFPIVFEIKED